MRRLLSLRSSQWVVVAAALIGLFAVCGFVLLPQLTEWYMVHVAAPELERVFGFHAQAVSVASQGVAFSALCIASVAPDGIFERAGVRVGDCPVYYAHGIATGFYGDLMRAQQGAAVDLRVVQVQDFQEGWQARRVSIRLP